MSESPTVEWRPIPGLAGYEVSRDGRVRSYWKCAVGQGRGHKVICGEPIEMRVQRAKDGRKRLILGQGANRRFRSVSVLVLTAFVGPRPPGMLACHNNGDPSNDLVTNLRWDTPKANSQDMLVHGRHDPKRGQAQKHAILTDEIVRLIRQTKGSVTQKAWAERLNCSKTTIYNVRAGRSWVTA